MKIQIEIVPDGFDEQGRPVFNNVESWLDEELWEKACDRVHSVATELVEKAVKEKIATTVSEMVSRAVSLPIAYEKGDPMNLSDIVLKKSRELMMARVDDRGREGYGQPYLEWAAKSAANDLVKKHVEEEIKNIGASLQQNLSKSLLEKFDKVQPAILEGVATVVREMFARAMR